MKPATRKGRRRWRLLAALGGSAVIGLLGVGWSQSSQLPPPQPRLDRGAHMLVIYYSRTGATAKLAEAIASATGADVEPLRDTVNRAGAWGFIRSIRDAAGKRGTVLEPLHVDPTRYDLVVIGTPDWGKSISAPVRTFLEAYRGHLGQVAFFLTDGEADHDAIFREMGRLAGREPVAVLGVAHDDVVLDRFEAKLRPFLKALPRPAVQTGVDAGSVQPAF